MIKKNKLSPSRRVPRSQTDFVGESLTIQSERDATDLNKIVPKLDPSMLPDPNQMTFADVSNSDTFSEVVEKINSVYDQFAGLPAQLRARFNNSAGVMLDWLADDANHAEAAELGLMVSPSPPSEPPSSPSEPPSPPSEPPSEPPSPPSEPPS